MALRIEDRGTILLVVIALLSLSTIHILFDSVSSANCGVLLVKFLAFSAVVA
jgi:hypothetical protein